MVSVEAIAGVSTLLACAISIHLIVRHLHTYTVPQYQKHIVRIVGMIPIYSLEAFLSLNLDPAAGYDPLLEAIRDSYEAYVIYVFISLLLAYAGGDHQLHLALELKQRMRHPWPFANVFRPLQLDARFIRRCKQGVMQFVFAKPFLAALALLMDHYDVLDEGSPRLDRWYVYIAFATNASVSVALYCLVLFYMATREALAKFKPLPKFLCIKTVVFFSFWQGVALLVLVKLGWLLTDIRQAILLQDTFICVEMLLASVAFHFAFPYSDYEVRARTASRGGSRLLHGVRDVMNINDVFSDAHNTFIHTPANHFELADYQESEALDVKVTMPSAQSSALQAAIDGAKREFGPSRSASAATARAGGDATGRLATGEYDSCDEDLVMVDSPSVVLGLPRNLDDGLIRDDDPGDDLADFDNVLGGAAGGDAAGADLAAAFAAAPMRPVDPFAGDISVSADLDADEMDLNAAG